MTQVIDKNVDNLVCVKLEVHIWGGRRHLEKGDLLQANPAFKNLPSEKLATLGAYKICDPDHIKRFQSIKGRAERALRRSGLPILGAWGIPSQRYQAVHEELVAIQAEFETLKSEFVKNYDAAVDKWRMEQLIENPEYGHLFNDTPAASHVERRMSFEFHPCRISAPAAVDQPALNERFDKQVNGLKGELMQEVATEANTLITEYLTTKKDGGVVQKREYVTPKTLGPLKRAAAKMASFQFLDPTIGPLADAINSIVSSLPPERIDGQSLLKVWGLARMLATPASALEMAALAAEGASGDDLIARSGVQQVSLAAEPAAKGQGEQPVAEAKLEPTEPMAPAPRVPPAAAPAQDLALLL